VVKKMAFLKIIFLVKRNYKTIKIIPTIFFVSYFTCTHTYAQCSKEVDVLTIGDSQSGATWAKSYFGNFLATCLKGNFVTYARGGTVPANWLGNGGMDQIETIQRTSLNPHQNIGSKEMVPECKKRIAPMLAAHNPKKVLYQFGSNMIGSTDQVVKKQVDLLMKATSENGIAPQNCFFMTASYEMEVTNRRNVPTRNLQTSLKINQLISEAINGRCQIINGLELMKDSPYFDQKDLLKRVIIKGLPGCGGSAVNDNVHICGEAARDMAERVCSILNSDTMIEE
jgi:hypothetical protein